MSKDNGSINDKNHKNGSQLILFNKVLRELRAEIQDLNNLLSGIKLGQTSPKDSANYIKKTCTDVETLIKELSEMNRDRRSDTVRHIFNLWEQMRENPILSSPEQDRPAQDHLHDLSMLEGQAAQIVLSVGHLTIPHRLNVWLEKARPGYYLPFHLLFEDELPSLKDRVRVLNSIAWAPDSLQNGIVSAENGLIYRYEKDRKARVISFLHIVFALFAATMLISFLCHFGTWVGMTNWLLKPDYAPNLLFGWGALLIGTLIHMAVSSVKRSQASGLPPVVAINDWMLHLSARKGDILLKILIAIFGLFGLAFTVGPGKVTPVNAFLIGYSVDSVVELFGTTIEQKAASQVSALKEQLGIRTERKE